MAEEKTEKVEKIKCPCCGELTLTKPVEIKSIILDEYMASIITGVPFTHTWELYNGTVKITVESLDKRGSTLLYAAVQVLEKWLAEAEKEENAKVFESSIPIVRELLGTIRLFYGVKTITILRDGKIQKQLMPSDTIRKAVDDIIEASRKKDDMELVKTVAQAAKICCSPDTISTLSDVIVRTVVVAHADLYTLLLDAGFDTNFWAGIELA